MARNEIFVNASPDDVFDVLSDARTYGYWVVGSREIRAADSNWPASGSAFDHTVGWGLVALRDHTEVEAARRPVYLKLRAKARPFPSARITVHLQPESEGSRLTMVEDLALPLGSLLLGPIGHLILRGRNAESLRRLKELAEGTKSVSGAALPSRA